MPWLPATCLTYFPGGLETLASAWRHRYEESDVKRGLEILREKFAAVEGFGPRQVVEFLDPSDTEARQIQARRASELVQRLLGLL